MSDAPDAELLEQFARNQSETAFTGLVERHIGLVYSTAVRKTGNPQQAEDITQAVFIILARKAGSLGPKTVLPGWLYHTARLTAANLQRAELRRIHREKEAFMQSTMNESPSDALWRELSPLLEDAMAGLGVSDRDAIVLRFFQNRSLAEVGAALGASEDAAKMRVNRALDKLRKFLNKRGVVSTTAVIAGVISNNSVQAAPAALAKTISAVAVAKGAAATGSTLTLVKGALKIMAWSKAKTAIVAGAIVLLTAGITTVSVKKYEAHQIALNSWRLETLYFHPEALSNALPQVRIVPTKFKAPVYGGRWVPPDKFAMVRATVVDIISSAYQYPQGQIFFSGGEPEGRYDFAATLPGDNRKALQQEIKKTFGLVAHEETRDSDVWALRVHNLNSSGLKLYDGQGTPGSFTDLHGRIICTGQPLARLAKRMETFLHVPVIDDTGLPGKYNLDLKWNEDSRQNFNHDLLKQALIGQLGLELVLTNMPMEMLVVEKAR